MKYELLDEDGDAVLAIADQEWMHRGACASSGQLTDDFFAEDTSAGEQTEQVLGAKRYCAGCVVRRDCLTWAMDLEEGETFRSGIFGGLTPNERSLVDQANDPISLGLRVLDEQVAQGLVLTRAQRYEEDTDEHRSSAER